MECSPPMRTNSRRTCSNSCVLEPWPDGVRRTDPGRSARISMRAQEHVQVVKDFFAALRRGDRPGALALCADDIEWIIPGHDWPLSSTLRGPPGFADLFLLSSQSFVTSFFYPPFFFSLSSLFFFFSFPFFLFFFFLLFFFL